MARYIFFLLLIAVNAVSGQKLKKEDKELINNLKTYISYLASDSLQGRLIGTAGEKMAMQYISNQFKLIGVQPKGTEGYYQSFSIDEGKQVNPSTRLSINGDVLMLNEDFFPFAYSPNGSIEAMPSMALQELQMPWFYDIREILKENSTNPHFDLYSAIKNKAREMQKKGATALFIYNTSTTEDDLGFEPSDHTELLKIPVLYISKKIANKYLKDEQATLNINLKTGISEKIRTGSNVVGYIDNGATYTAIIGAHFDHLGYGEDGNSLWRGSRQIHNGADDNASGTAAVLELGRLLKASKSKGNNYLLILFSGEEEGLYGSKYYAAHPTIDLAAVNYMINMDMVGRLNDSSHTLIVGGYGTSPTWGKAYSASGRAKLYSTNIVYKYDSSGIGPSDHTSFYLKNIPVLYYFTGLHSDYHKPSDDVDKINYEGEMHIVKHVYSLIEQLNKEKSKLLFIKTREEQNTNGPHFSVTLGILPDYTFNGTGLRIDGVSENRPAQKAGLQSGDVITELGSYKVQSIESYMKALSNYKKGEKTIISFRRGNETLQREVAFQ